MSMAVVLIKMPTFKQKKLHIKQTTPTDDMMEEEELQSQKPK